jgi:hypothetical protein
MPATMPAKAILAAVTAALLTAGCGAAAAASLAPSHPGRPSICTQPGAARAVVRARVPLSLDQWARVNGDSVADILGLTFACGNSARLDAYLDGGNLAAPMRTGTVLWYLLPGGGP